MYSTSIPAQISSQITAAQANLITAINFCNDGRNINVGTFDGRVLIYSNSLKYDVKYELIIFFLEFILIVFFFIQTVMNIGDNDGSHGHRSRKKRRKPCKITGIEPMNTNSSKVKSLRNVEKFYISTNNNRF